MKKAFVFSSVIFFILLFVGGAGYGLFAPKSKAAKDKANLAFKQGSDLYNQYHYTASMDFFLEALSYDPKHIQARRMLGQALYFSGEVNEAIQEWSLILEQGVFDPGLKLHIDNLNALEKDIGGQNLQFRFLRDLPSELGYRYSFPTFIGRLSSENLFLLGKDLSDNGNLLEINTNAKFINNFRRISKKLEFPMAGAHNSVELWITDFSQDIVHRMKWNQRHQNYAIISGLEPIGGKGSKEMQFRGAAGICYHNGFFFVVDNGNNRIQKISQDGKFNLLFSEKDDGNRILDPFGIACGSDGRVYVSEASRGLISVFDSFGSFEKNIGEDFLKNPRHLHINNESSLLTIADEFEGVFLLDLIRNKVNIIREYQVDEQKTDSIVRPYGALLDENQNLFVADYGGHRLLQFVPENYLYQNMEVWVERVDVNSFPVIALSISVRDIQSNYLNNLKDSNFMVSENGTIVEGLKSSYLEQYDDQISTVMVVSTSKNMRPYEESLQWVLSLIIKDIRGKDSVKLLSFSDHYKEETPWTSSSLKLAHGMRQIRKRIAKENKTSGAGQALYYAASSLLPQKGKKAVIWINDGNIPEDGFYQIGLQKLENFYRVNHISLYAVSFESPAVVNLEAQKNNLMKIVESTSGGYYRAYSSDIRNVGMRIREQKRKNYVVYYRTHANKNWKEQFMNIKVSVKYQGREGVEKAGYFIP